MPGKTRNGGKFLNHDVSLNTSEGDLLPCTYCHSEIVSFGGRENRVDCEEDNNVLVSYHLKCYDLALFGKVTKFTLKKMGKLGIE